MKKQTIIGGLVLLPIVFIAFTSMYVDMSEPVKSEKQMSPPKLGDIAPEIALLSPDGTTTYKLSDLRGKLVLVNFWASMVAQSRFENPNIVSTYNKFKDKQFSNGNGFEIFSVSLDTDPNKWKNAIEKDNLIWKYHVSDLKGYKSQVAQSYGVKTMPYNVLIDGSGKIIALNLKGGKLNQKMESLVK